MNENNQIEMKEVIYFEGCINGSERPNCTITNKKWRFNNMIIPINHVTYINIGTQANIKNAIYVIGAGIIMNIIGGTSNESIYSYLGIALLLVGIVMFLYYKNHPDYYIQVGTSQTEHCFKCNESDFRTIYLGMSEALNNRIF